LTITPTKRTLDATHRGGTTPRECPMAKVLMSAYAGVAVCFLRPYLKRPTAAGVIASLLWLVSLALTLAWLMFDDDALRV
jgi:hypothetical protein